MGIYVGHKSGDRKREVFRSDATPTEQSHGEQYFAVTGPFRTVRGAKALTHYGNGNPHIQGVSDAERIGKKYANELKRMPLSTG